MKNLISTLMLFFLIVSHIQGQHIYGTIIDERSNPLEGATISVEGSKIWAISDEEGSFTFSPKIEGDFTLIISYLGYHSDSIHVSLAPNEEIDLGIITLISKSRILENLTIRALSLESRSPFAYMNIGSEQIEKNNTGKDIPFLLRNTPSVVYSSDAGTGIGYTTMWIRGTDATRINVTLNGIPFNDSESLGTFWVDLPDFASSVQNIQLQRGVGTSSHGAGAFGATMNLQTISNERKPFAEFSQSAGSYNTTKSTIKFGSGLINDHWQFEGRLSSIKSDGYIDRGSADLKSYYLQSSFVKENYKIDFVNFSGKEITYQSWFGVPQSRIDNDVPAMEEHITNNGLNENQRENLLNSDRRYNFYTYDDQVDDYKQDHYQLHLNSKLSEKTKVGLALHYTKGGGFFEEHRLDDDYSDYGLPNPVIGQDTFTSADFVRRRWLDNDYYGLIANYESLVQDGLYIIAGAAFNKYQGDHFGELIKSSLILNPISEERYYDNTGDKSDFNVYFKLKLDIAANLILYSDIQYRHISYDIEGIDNDLRVLSFSEKYNFFNPKFGLSFYLTPESRFYISYGIANKEPNRTDFVDALTATTPESEQIKDIEIGYQYLKSNLEFSINGYFMTYDDQLVLTGALNDVGNPIRENIESSYRAGIEISGSYLLSNKLSLNANLTFSQNKIEDFTEIIYDFTNTVEIIENNYDKTDIAFSPEIIGNATFLYKPIDKLELELYTKYVGKQFLDNTSNEQRSLKSYSATDFRASYEFSMKDLKKINLGISVYNVLNSEYEANGYTYSYVFEKLITENFYYPQATRHFLASVSFKF